MPPGSHIDPTATSMTLKLTPSDISDALPTVRPSAMRSLFIETPPVRFEDIGGQAHIIQKLREAVEWPLLHPEAFQRLGVRPPKGLLLYGPPGCSKTVLARACATESGVNFVAVKGPEVPILVLRSGNLLMLCCRQLASKQICWRIGKGCAGDIQQSQSCVTFNNLFRKRRFTMEELVLINTG